MTVYQLQMLHYIEWDVRTVMNAVPVKIWKEAVLRNTKIHNGNGVYYNEPYKSLLHIREISASNLGTETLYWLNLLGSLSSSRMS